MPNRTHARPRLSERRSRPLPAAPLFALAILAMGIAYAQQNLPVPAPQPAAADPAQETSAAAPNPTSAETATPASDPAAESANETAPPPSPAAAKGSPQRFEPTEKVRPDFDVAFPVDI